LHGNIPQYIPSPSHPDSLLHTKLIKHSDLLHLEIPRLTEHFEASQFSYSTQALPINVLLDTLIRPNGDIDDLEKATNVVWTYQPQRAIAHLVIGNTISPGGQWVDNPVQASHDIGTLSYAGMLSLPGYSFAEHYRRTTGNELPPFTRPSRRQVTDYFRHYPHRVMIIDAIHCGETVAGITRTPEGFQIKSHGLSCKHLVLASGVFSELIPAPTQLQPLLHLPGPSAQSSSPDASLLVIGSGFSAADVITSCPPHQKIIHIYKWAPSTSPSPLRACHQQAYPEYAGVYRRMKQAAQAITDSTRTASSRPKIRRASTSAFDISRDWDSNYEGFPNTTITDVRIEGQTAVITLQTPNPNQAIFHRRVTRLEYVVGRRGSLRYLSRDLRREIFNNKSITDETDSGDVDSAEMMLSGQTLRSKVLEDLELAPNVFAIGSLTGDSLIRFAYGSCTYAAARIMVSAPHAERDSQQQQQQQQVNGFMKPSAPSVSRLQEGRTAARVMNGLDGHHRRDSSHE
jgi:hypothetical protein